LKGKKKASFTKKKGKREGKRILPEKTQNIGGKRKKSRDPREASLNRRCAREKTIINNHLTGGKKEGKTESSKGGGQDILGVGIPKKDFPPLPPDRKEENHSERGRGGGSFFADKKIGGGAERGCYLLESLLRDKKKRRHQESAER